MISKVIKEFLKQKAGCFLQPGCVNSLPLVKWLAIVIMIVWSNVLPARAQNNNGGVITTYKAKDITGTADLANTLALNTGQSTTLNYNDFPVPVSQQSKEIKNLISFGIVEEAAKYIPADFTATLELTIEYGHSQATAATITKTFQVNYKKGAGEKFNAEQYWSFNDFEYVKITVGAGSNFPAVGSLNTEDVLAVKHSMTVTRFLALVPAYLAPLSFGHVTLPPPPLPGSQGLTPDHVTVNWAWSPDAGNNTTQLEWLWLEDEMAPAGFDPNNLNNIQALFKTEGATRVEIAIEDAQTYEIPLLYDGQGKLYYRIRAVNSVPLTGQSSMGEWSYPAGPTYYCAFWGHNNSLNWQATTTFAEEGKRKTVIQYYDGSLRGRQTVTKDNSTNKVLFAESMYDREGRAVIQILPTPGITSILEYQKNLNMFNGQAINQDPSEIFDLEPATAPGIMSLATSSGTSKYYSPQNPNSSGTDKNIPDAEGYPYTVTQFTPDATGRILAQSGVGAAHQLGSGHETKYYYGTPGQEELDGLFGTEAGNFTHYSKNMVRDANKQISVSYVDMHGRTVATALAGDCPPNLEALDINNSNHYPNQAGSLITRNLLDATTNVTKSNSIESISTLLVVKDNTSHEFSYKLNDLKLEMENCPSAQPASLCYDCVYDLEITITNDEGTSAPMVRKYTNISLGSQDDDCATPALPFAVYPGLPGNEALPSDISTVNGVNTITFTKPLNTGGYTIRKTLTINETAFQKYRELYLSKALCKTEQQLIDSVYSVLLTSSNCGTVTPLTCQSCKDALGTLESFKTAYLQNTGITNPGTELLAEIEAAYNTEVQNCNKLCTNISQTLPAIRQMMLQDMVPFTGQYATEVAANGAATMYQKYNIFTTTVPAGTMQPFYKNPNVNADNERDYYYNDQNTIDLTIHPDPAINPYNYLDGLTPGQFAADFNLSWAKSLLPHHPEYARLKYAEDNLTPSFNWITTFSQTNDLATAQLPANNYLNPLVSDPFFAIAPSYVSVMQGQINNYQGGGVSMWQLAYGDVKCKSISNVPQRTSCYTGAPTTPPPYSGDHTLTPAEEILVWQRFRDLYAAKRNDLLNEYIATQVPLPATDETDLLAQGFRLWFPRNDQQTASQSGWASWWPQNNGNGGPGGGPNGNPGGISGNPAQTYDGRCSSYIDRWKAILLQCTAIAGKDETERTAILNAITTGMQQVCVKGSDAANPYGSSNVKPSTPVDGSPRTFEEVINSVLQSHGITRDMYCNPFVIDWPKPYGKNPPMSESGPTGMLTNCNCEQFAKIKQNAIAANVDPNNLAALNVYLDNLYGETLTPGMFAALQQCGGDCTCSDLQNTINLFYQAYPGGGGGGGCNVPAHLSINSRSGNTPPSYVATIDIEFLPDFESGTGDEFIAYINPSGNCDPVEVCHQNFTNFFNSHYGYNPPLTWTQVEALYVNNCGNPPSVCGYKDYSCANLMRVACKFRKYNAAHPEYNLCSVAAMGITGSFPPFFRDYFHDTGMLSFEEIEAIYQNACSTPTAMTMPLADLLCSQNSTLNCSLYECRDTIILPQGEPMPKFLTCGFDLNSRKCITCAQLSTYTKEFKEQQFATAPYNYSNAPHFYQTGALTTQQVKENILFARFINYRTGFQYSWLDYAEKAKYASPECSISNSNYNNNAGAGQTVICGKAKPLNDPHEILPPDETPCQKVYTMAIHIAAEIRRIQRETKLKEFENAYKQKCLATAGMENFTVTYLQSEYHYTLYYYDQAGNLVKTVPPKGVRPDFSAAYTSQVAADRQNNVVNTRPHEFTTNYRYNSLNQVVAQKTPDAGTSRFWYDKLGRLVVSQNAQQAVQTPPQYSYTLYDDLGRITEVGQKAHTTPMTQTISQDQDAQTTLANWINGSGGTKEQITRTVYDVEYLPALNQQNLRNKVSYTTVTKTDGQPFYAGSFYSYDIHGNVDVLQQDYNGVEGLATADKLKKITYEYDLISGKVNRVNYQPGQPDAYYHRYNYDAENRTTSVETSRDAIKWETDARYNYYQYGPLSRTVLGQLNVQGIDYAYTLQGWLKGVNSSSLSPTGGSTGTYYDIGGDGYNQSTVARDVFGFALHYFDDGASQYDYKPIGGAGLNTFARPIVTGTQFKSLYNGNIAAMTVNNGGLKYGPAATTNALPLFNRYRYDQLNRIVSMQVYKGLDEAANTWAPVAIDDYKEQVSYDPNGNILTYNRNGSPSIAGMQTAMDDLTYEYIANSNKLKRVGDLVPKPSYKGIDIDDQPAGENYTYDKIGNLVTDRSENIVDPLDLEKPMITWNVYGKIEKIVKTNGLSSTPVTTINYGYDAAGNRISKKVETAEGTAITVYVRDASGNVMSVYEKAQNEALAAQTETHLYGSSRLGLAGKLTVPPVTQTLTGNITAIMSTFTRGEKLFELSNHLGNVLVTISDKRIAFDNTEDGLVDYYEADVATANDYYPFGMAMPGRKFSIGNQYRYGFNGKENDKDISEGGQDYGMRIYDVRLGKFLSVDPLTKHYPWYTPYQFAGNKPILATDLDGLEENSTSTYSKKPIPILATPAFNGTITIADATSQEVHSVFSGNFQQLRKADPSGLSTSLVNQLTTTDPGTKASSLSLTSTGTRTEISKTWKGTDNKYFAQYSYSLSNNNVTEQGTFEIQTGQIQVSERIWSPLAFLIVNRVITTVIEASVVTAFGKAIQSISAEALEASKRVFNGIKLYRLGKEGLSAKGADAQFWSLENPLAMSAEEYAKKYGIPLKNVQNADFVETAILKDGAKYITREAPPAPGAPANSGGGIEAVVEKGGTAANVITPIKR